MLYNKPKIKVNINQLGLHSTAPGDCQGDCSPFCWSRYTRGSSGLGSSPPGGSVGAADPPDWSTPTSCTGCAVQTPPLHCLGRLQTTVHSVTAQSNTHYPNTVSIKCFLLSCTCTLFVHNFLATNWCDRIYREAHVYKQSIFWNVHTIDRDIEKTWVIFQELPPVE